MIHQLSYGGISKDNSEIFVPKVCRELPYLQKENKASHFKINMTKEEISNSWGDVFWVKTLPLPYKFGPDYVKLYEADEMWEYPKEKRYFREEKAKFGSTYGFYYVLLFKKGRLIKILEMKQLIK